jgi:hypothetical protein
VQGGNLLGVHWIGGVIGIAFPHYLRSLSNGRSSGWGRRLPGWLNLVGKLVAPPPKSTATKQCDQNDADNRDPDCPANRESRNHEKDKQDNNARDYGDCGKAHFSVVSGQ